MRIAGGRFGLRVILCFGFLCETTFVSSAADQKGFKLKNSHKLITAPIHLLNECRRQFTFLASAALGVYITKVIKESPLTPLPLTPLSDKLHWNLISVPAHAAAPFYQWAQVHPGAQPVILNQGINSLTKRFGELKQTLKRFDKKSPDWKKTLLRIASRTLEDKTTRALVFKAVQHTLKPLKHVLPHALGIRRWLTQWCH